MPKFPHLKELNYFTLKKSNMTKELVAELIENNQNITRIKGFDFIWNKNILEES